MNNYKWFLIAWIFLLAGCRMGNDFESETYDLTGKATLKA
jgi:hypothetical protein